MTSNSSSPYLAPTRYIDSDHDRVVAFAREAVGDASTDREKAIRLYYAVRDGIRYNPYRFGIDHDAFRASEVIAAGEQFCVPKALLLAAVARAVGIPSRVGFADVKNHIASPRLLELLRTDIFTFHGYTELFIEGKWVKATPAFNKTLCEKFNLAPLEFDGVHDAIFHAFDLQGNDFMEYLHDHGTFADMPFDLMVDAFRRHYPHLFDGSLDGVTGDLEAEGPG